MKKVISFVLCLSLILGSFTGAFAASDTKKITGTTLKLTSTSGDVSVTARNGKEKTIKNYMKLLSGYTVKTDAKSYAFVSIDQSKAIKLDASTEIEIIKSGKKLEILLVAGQIYCDVSEKLAEDESMTIRTNTMVTGIRGTNLLQGEDFVELFEGQLNCTILETGEEKKIDAGYKLEVKESKEAEEDTDEPGKPKPAITVIKPLEAEDVPGFVAVEIKKSLAVQGRLNASLGNPLVIEIINDSEDKLAEDEKKAEEAVMQVKDEDMQVITLAELQSSPGALEQYPILSLDNLSEEAIQYKGEDGTKNISYYISDGTEDEPEEEEPIEEPEDEEPQDPEPSEPTPSKPSRTITVPDQVIVGGVTFASFRTVSGTSLESAHVGDTIYIAMESYEELSNGPTADAAGSLGAGAADESPISAELDLEKVGEETASEPILAESVYYRLVTKYYKLVVSDNLDIKLNVSINDPDKADYVQFFLNDTKHVNKVSVKTNENDFVLSDIDIAQNQQLTIVYNVNGIGKFIVDNTVTNAGILSVDEGIVLDISSGAVLLNNGSLSIGTRCAISNNGTIDNNCSLTFADSCSISNNGTIDNKSQMTLSAQCYFLNNEEFNNSGSLVLAEAVVIENNAGINNSGDIALSESSAINNCGNFESTKSFNVPAIGGFVNANDGVYSGPAVVNFWVEDSENPGEYTQHAQSVQIDSHKTVADAVASGIEFKDIKENYTFSIRNSGYKDGDALTQVIGAPRLDVLDTIKTYNISIPNDLDDEYSLTFTPVNESEKTDFGYIAESGKDFAFKVESSDITSLTAVMSVSGSATITQSEAADNTIICTVSGIRSDVTVQAMLTYSSTPENSIALQTILSDTEHILGADITVTNDQTFEELEISSGQSLIVRPGTGTSFLHIKEGTNSGIITVNNENRSDGQEVYIILGVADESVFVNKDTIELHNTYEEAALMLEAANLDNKGTIIRKTDAEGYYPVIIVGSLEGDSDVSYPVSLDEELKSSGSLSSSEAKLGDEITVTISAEAVSAGSIILENSMSDVPVVIAETLCDSVSNSVMLKYNDNSEQGIIATAGALTYSLTDDITFTFAVNELLKSGSEDKVIAPLSIKFESAASGVYSISLPDDITSTDSRLGFMTAASFRAAEGYSLDCNRAGSDVIIVAERISLWSDQEGTGNPPEIFIQLETNDNVEELSWEDFSEPDAVTLTAIGGKTYHIDRTYYRINANEDIVVTADVRFINGERYDALTAVAQDTTHVTGIQLLDNGTIPGFTISDTQTVTISAVNITLAGIIENNGTINIVDMAQLTIDEESTIENLGTINVSEGAIVIAENAKLNNKSSINVIGEGSRIENNGTFDSIYSIELPGVDSYVNGEPGVYSGPAVVNFWVEDAANPGEYTAHAQSVQIDSHKTVADAVSSNMEFQNIAENYAFSIRNSGYKDGDALDQVIGAPRLDVLDTFKPYSVSLPINIEDTNSLSFVPVGITETDKAMYRAESEGDFVFKVQSTDITTLTAVMSVSGSATIEQAEAADNSILCTVSCIQSDVTVQAMLTYNSVPEKSIALQTILSDTEHILGADITVDRQQSFSELSVAENQTLTLRPGNVAADAQYKNIYFIVSSGENHGSIVVDNSKRSGHTALFLGATSSKFVNEGSIQLINTYSQAEMMLGVNQLENAGTLVLTATSGNAPIMMISGDGYAEVSDGSISYPVGVSSALSAYAQLSASTGILNDEIEVAISAAAISNGSIYAEYADYPVTIAATYYDKEKDEVVFAPFNNASGELYLSDAETKTYSLSDDITFTLIINAPWTFPSVSQKVISDIEIGYKSDSREVYTYSMPDDITATIEGKTVTLSAFRAAYGTLDFVRSGDSPVIAVDNYSKVYPEDVEISEQEYITAWLNEENESASYAVNKLEDASMYQSASVPEDSDWNVSTDFTELVISGDAIVYADVHSTFANSIDILPELLADEHIEYINIENSNGTVKELAISENQSLSLSNCIITLTGISNNYGFMRLGENTVLTVAEGAVLNNYDTISLISGNIINNGTINNIGTFNEESDSANTIRLNNNSSLKNTAKGKIYNYKDCSIDLMDEGSMFDNAGYFESNTFVELPNYTNGPDATGVYSGSAVVCIIYDSVENEEQGNPIVDSNMSLGAISSYLELDAYDLEVISYAGTKLPSAEDIWEVAINTPYIKLNATERYVEPYFSVSLPNDINDEDAGLSLTFVSVDGTEKLDSGYQVQSGSSFVFKVQSSDITTLTAFMSVSGSATIQQNTAENNTILCTVSGVTSDVNVQAMLHYRSTPETGITLPSILSDTDHILGADIAVTSEQEFTTLSVADNQTLILRPETVSEEAESEEIYFAVYSGENKGRILVDNSGTNGHLALFLGYVDDQSATSFVNEGRIEVINTYADAEVMLYANNLENAGRIFLSAANSSNAAIMKIIGDGYSEVSGGSITYPVSLGSELESSATLSSPRANLSSEIKVTVSASAVSNGYIYAEYEGQQINVAATYYDKESDTVTFNPFNNGSEELYIKDSSIKKFSLSDDITFTISVNAPWSVPGEEQTVISDLKINYQSDSSEVYAYTLPNDIVSAEGETLAAFRTLYGPSEYARSGETLIIAVDEYKDFASESGEDPVSFAYIQADDVSGKYEVWGEAPEDYIVGSPSKSDDSIVSTGYYVVSLCSDADIKAGVHIEDSEQYSIVSTLMADSHIVDLDLCTEGSISNLKVSESQNVYVYSDVSLTGTCDNAGYIDIRDGGTITIPERSVVNNSGQICIIKADIYNKGTINNTGNLQLASGGLDNAGSIINNGNINATQYVVLEDDNNSVESKIPSYITNSGIITNAGLSSVSAASIYLVDYASLKNTASGQIYNISMLDKTEDGVAYNAFITMQGENVKFDNEGYFESNIMQNLLTYTNGPEATGIYSGPAIVSVIGLKEYEDAADYPYDSSLSLSTVLQETQFEGYDFEIVSYAGTRLDEESVWNKSIGTPYIGLKATRKTYSVSLPADIYDIATVTFAALGEGVELTDKGYRVEYDGEFTFAVSSSALKMLNPDIKITGDAVLGEAVQSDEYISYTISGIRSDISVLVNLYYLDTPKEDELNLQEALNDTQHVIGAVVHVSNPLALSSLEIYEGQTVEFRTATENAEISINIGTNSGVLDVNNKFADTSYITLSLGTENSDVFTNNGEILLYNTSLESQNMLNAINVVNAGCIKLTGASDTLNNAASMTIFNLENVGDGYVSYPISMSDELTQYASLSSDTAKLNEDILIRVSGAALTNGGIGVEYTGEQVPLVTGIVSDDAINIEINDGFGGFGITAITPQSLTCDLNADIEFMLAVSHQKDTEQTSDTLMLAPVRLIYIVNEQPDKPDEPEPEDTYSITLPSDVTYNNGEGEVSFAAFRTVSGTAVDNNKAGDVVYVAVDTYSPADASFSNKGSVTYLSESSGKVSMVGEETSSAVSVIEGTETPSRKEWLVRTTYYEVQADQEPTLRAYCLIDNPESINAIPEIFYNPSFSTVALDAVVNSDDAPMSSDMTIGISQGLTLNNESTLYTSGKIQNNGMISIVDQSTLSVQSMTNAGTLNLGSGTLSNNGTLYNSGCISLESEQISAETKVSMFINNTDASLANAGQIMLDENCCIENYGTFSISGDVYMTSASINNAGTIVNDASVDNTHNLIYCMDGCTFENLITDYGKGVYSGPALVVLSAAGVESQYIFASADTSLTTEAASDESLERIVSGSSWQYAIYHGVEKTVYEEWTLDSELNRPFLYLEKKEEQDLEI